MPNFTAIQSPEDLIPFNGCFVRVTKPTGEDTIAYFSSETSELWLIRQRGRWLSLSDIEAIKRKNPFAYISELQNRHLYVCKLDSDYFDSLSQNPPFQLAHLTSTEITTLMDRFRAQSITLSPNNVCPDAECALSILNNQLKSLGNQVVETPGHKIFLQTIIKETFSQLKRQTWKALPTVANLNLASWEVSDSDTLDQNNQPSGLHILAADIHPFQFDEANRVAVINALSKLLKEKIKPRFNPIRDIDFIIEKTHGACEARLFAQTFLPEKANAYEPTAFFSQIEKDLLDACDPSLSFDQYQPTGVKPLFGLFASPDQADSATQPIRFRNDVIPYAGMIVFYEMPACQPKRVTQDWFDCIKLGDQYVFPGYVSRTVANRGLNYCYQLTQLVCHRNQSPESDGGVAGTTYELHSYQLSTMKLRLRLPTADELTQLKEAYQHGRLKLIVSDFRPCSRDEFASLIESQRSNLGQDRAEPHLRLSSS